MASIQPHGAGFRVFYTADGARRASETLPTRESAEAWIAERLPAALDGHLFSIIDLWRAEDPTPHREDAADRLGNLVRKRGWSTPERLTVTDIKAWVKVDPAWRRPCQYLRTVLRWAAREHRLPIRREVLEWKPPRAQRQAKPPLLTDRQVAFILDRASHLGTRAHAIIDYLATYGARPITACRLRWPAFDGEHGELVLGMKDAATGRMGEKHSGGWRHRIYPRHLDAWPRLSEPWCVSPAAPPASIPIFPHYAENRPWRVDKSADELASFYVNRIGRPLANQLGSLTGIYHLKRYAITRLFRAGVDPGTIALFTGHMDQNQLMTYATSNAELQDTALAKLESLGNQACNHVTKI